MADDRKLKESLTFIKRTKKMKTNKFMLVLAFGAACAQTDIQDSGRSTPWRTVIPLAVTTLLVGSSHSDASDLPRFDTPTCNQALGSQLLYMGSQNPRKGDYPLNVLNSFQFLLIMNTLMGLVRRKRTATVRSWSLSRLTLSVANESRL